MSETSELIAKQIMNGNINKKTWGDILYNVKVYGAFGDGVKDDTSAIQSAIDAAIANGSKNIFFPHGTYKVSSLTGLDSVILLGDNSAFVGISNYIAQFGALPETIFYNVKDYGATGDGVTVETTSIQAAIDAATDGGIVFLPPGSYYINTGTLNMLGKSLFLVGSGRDATKILVGGSTNNNAVNVDGCPSWGVRDLTIKHLGSPTGGSAINVNCGNGWIENVLIQLTYNGVKTKNAQANRYRNVDIYHFNNYGMSFEGNNNDNYITDCFIDGEFSGVAGASNVGLRMTGKCDAHVFSRVEIILCNYPIQTDIADAILPSFCRFESVFFDSCNNPAHFDQAKNFMLTNCWFSNRPSYGCHLLAVTDFVFSQCSFVNSGQHGCVVETGAKRVRFLGCTFEGNSTVSTGTSHGLLINGGTTDFVVQGCTAYNSGSYGVQAWGIIVTGGASDRYIIADNIVSGNGTGGVSDGGTGVNKRVANNY